MIKIKKEEVEGDDRRPLMMTKSEILFTTDRSTNWYNHSAIEINLEFV